MDFHLIIIYNPELVGEQGRCDYSHVKVEKN